MREYGGGWRRCLSLDIIQGLVIIKEAMNWKTKSTAIALAAVVWAGQGILLLKHVTALCWKQLSGPAACLHPGVLKGFLPHYLWTFVFPSTDVAL